LHQKIGKNVINPYFDIIVRSLAVYFFMVAGIRIFGKNQLSQLNAGDVVLLLLISNAVQNAMVGENTSLAGGLVAALVLFVANYFLKKFIFKSPKVKEILESEPDILIKDGVMYDQNLKKEKISTDELLEAVREHGVDDIKQVKLAMLEVDGNISVISFDAQTNQTRFTRHRRKKMTQQQY